ncbi:hypothetical protein E6C76_12665 [Pseudothauera nasutitermitis]|uniref:Uncharacterized protein n=1 Tax=Pseudothauera nasutitermitis TaxID=2565930 RepID=A0A4V3WBX1_9RHOO|nr:hypothetical protein [Pseudothauera nasutitermitis]THF64879.1 hypothetical protein E6C76_12665 [Pseudothauera nasutitermitis]
MKVKREPASEIPSCDALDARPVNGVDLAALLEQLDADIRANRRVRQLPAGFAHAMRSSVRHMVDLTEEIRGDVVL